jgi:quercetin dioxygenase-like cupin family protein
VATTRETTNQPVSAERPVVKCQGPGRWQGTEVMPYKEEGSAPFRDVTRQKLFAGNGDLDVELRYFEVGPGGYSTLERHQHAHLVVVARGSGTVVVGSEVREIGLHDLVHVPPLTWHQFLAGAAEPLGFLCLVKVERDRPERPSAEQMAEITSDPAVGAVVRV